MKFLCSILILAGVFALNDAFPSFDDNLRLANDEMILEDLKMIVADRDAASSVQCSQEYLEGLSKVLENYNNDLKECEDAAQISTNELNEDVRKKIKGFNSSITSACSNDCSSETEPSVGLDCIEQVSSKNSRSLSDMSVQAASLRVELQKSIEDIQGIEGICKQDGFVKYNTDSQAMEDAFKKCVQSKAE